jgi:hypothetical protein
LAAAKAPTSLSQLVMWRLTAGLDWNTISQLSAKWANQYELTLARDFVDRLQALPEGETGRLLFEVKGTDAASESMAAELNKAVDGKVILGLIAHAGIPARPDGPAVACKIRLTPTEALVQVASSDAAARNWVPFGKFTHALLTDKGKFDTRQFADALAEGVLSRLVRAQVTKEAAREKGKLLYMIRIENASPLILNGLALLGTTSKADEEPKVLSGIGIPPRRTMTVPATEEVVRTLGLKKGIKLVALDLSGL